MISITCSDPISRLSEDFVRESLDETSGSPVKRTEERVSPLCCVFVGHPIFYASC